MANCGGRVLWPCGGGIYGVEGFRPDITGSRAVLGLQIRRHDSSCSGANQCGQLRFVPRRAVPATCARRRPPVPAVSGDREVTVLDRHLAPTPAYQADAAYAIAYVELRLGTAHVPTRLVDGRPRGGRDRIPLGSCSTMSTTHLPSIASRPLPSTRSRLEGSTHYPSFTMTPDGQLAFGGRMPETRRLLTLFEAPIGSVRSTSRQRARGIPDDVASLAPAVATGSVPTFGYLSRRHARSASQRYFPARLPPTTAQRSASCTHPRPRSGTLDPGRRRGPSASAGVSSCSTTSPFDDRARRAWAIYSLTCPSHVLFCGRAGVPRRVLRLLGDIVDPCGARRPSLVYRWSSGRGPLRARWIWPTAGSFGLARASFAACSTPRSPPDAWLATGGRRPLAAVSSGVGRRRARSDGGPRPPPVGVSASGLRYFGRRW